MIDITGIPKADVLMALHDAAVPQVISRGYSRLPMERNEAEKIVEQDLGYTYVNGRAMFVSIAGNEVDATRYDAANGRGCAEKALEPLRARVTT